LNYFFLLLSLAFPLLSYAAAPDDINSNQRAWFDAVDINADNDYTNNPGNNAAIALWNDKSGSGNHISQTIATSQPRYLLDNISTGRHGVKLDGIDDELIDANDIWLGSVSSAESFLVATTDKFQTSSLFASTDNHTNRLSVHLPWGSVNTFFDQGICCGTPARLYGNIPISLQQPYVWYFAGLPNLQGVFQDGKIRLSDAGAGTYTVTANSSFNLGGWPVLVSGHIHAGRYFEAIFYQTALNNAQRSILHSYLSAKWDKTLDASPTYSDVYAGDNAANGDYDFFVGGIGQDNGLQKIATSQGLTITDTSFLTNDGKFILAGVDYLGTAPPIGTTVADVPMGYSQRSNRSWYIDRTGNDGLVNLSFDAAELGIPISNGSNYGLLHRSNVTGIFSEVAVAVMANGAIDFSYLPDDGVYVIGIKGKVALSLDKVSQTVRDPINLTLNPKSIPGSNTDYTLTIKNTGDGIPDTDTTIIRDNIPSELTLFTGDLDGNGSPFVFTDSQCPPTSNPLNSNLTLDYPAKVLFRDATGNELIPSMAYDSAVRSFEITMSGSMNASLGGMVPCFSIRYRTRLD